MSSMYKRCNRCKNKISCSMNHYRLQDIKELISSTKNYTECAVDVNKKGVITVKSKRPSKPGVLTIFSMIHIQYYKNKWRVYHEEIDCPIIKTQLNNIVKKFGYDLKKTKQKEVIKI